MHALKYQVYKLWPMDQLWYVVNKVILAFHIAQILSVTTPFIKIYFHMHCIGRVYQ
jgi:hypothetical protein